MREPTNCNPPKEGAPRWTTGRELMAMRFCGECDACRRGDGRPRSLTERRKARLRDREITDCYYCWRTGSPTVDPDGSRWHWDHKEPLSRGGWDWAENMVKCCARCNLSKRSMTEQEFFEVLR